MKKTLLMSTVLANILAAGHHTSAWSSFSNEDLIQALSPTQVDAGKGVTFNIQLQDGSVGGLEMKKVYFSNTVEFGPSDDKFIYAGSKRAGAKVREDRDYTSIASGRISATMYAGMKETSNLFQSGLITLLTENPGDEKIRNAATNFVKNTQNVFVDPQSGDQVNSENGSSLYYFPFGEEMSNAYYSRYKGDDGYTYRIIVMGYYPSENNPNLYVFTAQQPDILWHEMGHALLDGLRDDLFNNSPQAGTYHEAFGDMNTLFTALSYDELRTYALNETGYDLHKPNVIAHMAEKFGADILGTHNGLRDLDDNLKNTDIANSGIHRRSGLLAGAVYDILVKGYEDRVRVHGLPSKNLNEVSDFLRLKMLYTTCHISDEPEFVEIGNILKKALPENDYRAGYNLPWQSYASEVFSDREIDLEAEHDSWSWNDMSGQDWFSFHGGQDHLELDREIVKEFKR